MKVKVVFECDDNIRRAVNAWYGEEGKATHARMKEFFRDYGESTLSDICYESRIPKEGPLRAAYVNDYHSLARLAGLK
jgi:hypothetical protein|tara:strand:- start:262 stop:495 length:234 start_codon:yes stop_codon:yes gene_type:complete